MAEITIPAAKASITITSSTFSTLAFWIRLRKNLISFSTRNCRDAQFYHQFAGIPEIPYPCVKFPDHKIWRVRLQGEEHVAQCPRIGHHGIDTNSDYLQLAKVIGFFDALT